MTFQHRHSDFLGAGLLIDIEMPKNRDPTMITNVSFSSLSAQPDNVLQIWISKRFLRFQDMPHQFLALNFFFFVIHDGGDKFPDFVSACLIACFWCHVFFLGGMVDHRFLQQALDFGCLAGRGSDKSSRETGVRTQQWFHIMQALS